MMRLKMLLPRVHAISSNVRAIRIVRTNRIVSIALIALAVALSVGCTTSPQHISAENISADNLSSHDTSAGNTSSDNISSDNISSEKNSVDKLSTTRIPIDDLRRLSLLGDELTFEDFDNYMGMDASSNFNYHIMCYTVEGGYRLIVRTDGKQIDSADLERIWDSSGRGIDIRHENVDEFIKLHPSLPSNFCEPVTKADVDSNVGTEHIYIDKSKADEGIVKLYVFDGSGAILWGEELSTSHAGWGSLFLCELEGKQYLLRYNPYIVQGHAKYAYSLFTLDNGKVQVNLSNEIEFDIIGDTELITPDMEAFANEINSLLEKSTLLVSTKGGEYFFGPSSAEQFLETYP